MNKRYSFYLILITSTLLGCNKVNITVDSDRVPVMSVNNEVLYADEIENILPANITGKDSVNFVENYKKNWAINILLYEKAEQNLRSTEEIDLLTEEYRKQLIINRYQQELS